MGDTRRRRPLRVICGGAGPGDQRLPLPGPLAPSRPLPCASPSIGARLSMDGLDCRPRGGAPGRGSGSTPTTPRVPPAELSRLAEGPQSARPPPAADAGGAAGFGLGPRPQPRLPPAPPSAIATRCSPRPRLLERALRVWLGFLPPAAPGAVGSGGSASQLGAPRGGPRGSGGTASPSSATSAPAGAAKPPVTDAPDVSTAPTLEVSLVPNPKGSAPASAVPRLGLAGGRPRGGRPSKPARFPCVPSGASQLRCGLSSALRRAGTVEPPFVPS